jgi:2-methylisocitrate lyase-like PEP mutase family enzyme
MTKADELRKRLAGEALLEVPCCSDALSAKLIAEAGFPATFMSGFAVSAARLGMPDTGLISFAEMRDQLANICAAVPGTIVMADGDTGYGNALNAQRTVREYARAGAACIMIEDQVSPKRCGHTQGKRVVDREEARLRVRAAVEAARECGILVIARTDARAVLGMDEALDRCRAFQDEGADIIFFEAPESEREMEAACRAVAQPMMANMVKGGKTPVLPAKRLFDIGYRLAVYPMVPFAAAIHAMQQSLKVMREGAGSAVPEASFEEIKRVAGFPEYYAMEQRFAGPKDPAG